MIITPQTNVRILSNVPLDTEYEHTIYFNTPAAQEAYFSGKTKYNLGSLTYVKPDSNVVRVGITADNLYDCNYMMFQNTAFGTKWFYAYITSVVYINNITAEITFDIDVMQTWFFDYDIDYCFVERCHTPTDLIGEHIEPENLNVGELIYNNYETVTELTNFYIIMAIVDATNGVAGTRYDQVYSGATLWAFPANDVSGLNGKLEEYIESPDSIIAMYCVPSAYVLQTVVSGGVELNPSSALPVVISTDKPSTADSLDGYYPHNCKMYTYPYNFWNITNGSGSNLALRYEMFGYGTSGQALCQILGTITPPVGAALYPMRYKGSPAGKEYMGESISIGQFPQCAWNTDSYKAWLAQNSIPLALGVGAGALQTGIGIAAGNPISLAHGTASVIGQVTGIMTQMYNASIAADVSKGNLNNGGVLSANKLNTFFHGRMSVNQYTARIIDNYFDMFGYGVKRVQKVMRNARPEWTYVKTIGANLSGSVPADSLKRIIQIYDRGCTFWQNGDNVGNYGLPNLATSRG